MKILVYMGGLGNQIFCYAFTQFMTKNYPLHNIFGVYSSTKLNEHHGLEINKWFDVQLPKEKWYATFLTYFLYFIKKVTGWQGLLDLDQQVIHNKDAIVYFALKIDKRYIPEGEWIKFNISDNILGFKNLEVLRKIRQQNSVFIHVRKGDYLSPEYIKRFEGCCSLDYYEKALKYIQERIDSPIFYVFSDDIIWCQRNLPIQNAVFVDWNTGERSPIDMFLMSNCKSAIIANSTFSYWGALLGEKKKIVTYPSRWINPPASIGDIFPNEWIKI